LAFNASLDGLFLVFNAFLELNNSILSVFLFLLDVLHKLVENVFRLELLFFGASVLLELSFENLLLRLKRDFLFRRADFSGDEVLLHALEHVLVLRLGHHLLVDFSVRLLEGVLELLLSSLRLVDGSFSVDFLLLESPDFFLDFLEVKLLLVHHLVGIVVLLLDLGKLHGHFSDLLGVVLLGSSIVGGVE
jgi:hypothetical protein